MGPHTHRVSKEELMEFAAEKFLTAQKPSWAPTNGVKALAWFGKHACICTIITASFLGEPCLAGWLVFSFSIYSYSAHPIGRPTLYPQHNPSMSSSYNLRHSINLHDTKFDMPLLITKLAGSIPNSSLMSAFLVPFFEFKITSV